jgi:hypothetical protein
MADDCDCGLMFWDGRSKGTKDNMDYMEKIGKNYLVLSETETALEALNRNIT